MFFIAGISLVLASIGVFYQSIYSQASAIHAKAEDCWKKVTYF